MARKIRRLEALNPGDRFVTAYYGRKGTLIGKTPSSATVVWDGARRVRFEVKNGDGENASVAFEGSNRRVTISLGTEVVRLVGRA